MIGDIAVETQGFETFVRETAKEMTGAEKRRFYRAYALAFLEKVIGRTPVDSGRARAAWTAAGSRLPGISRLRIGGNDHAAEAQGRREGKYAEKGMHSGAPEPSIEIYNGVPYITFLEFGSSRQAPSGFVRISLRELSKEMTDGERRRVEAAMRAANIKARAVSGLRQGGPARNPLGRSNLARR